MRNKTIITWSAVGVVALVALVALSMWGIPKYRIYQLEMRGKASLAEAEWEKKIAIEEARAKQESAALLAAAEIERASGVAAANRIIGESLQGNEGYLRYLWIQGLQDGSSEVIYIPTEAGLPLLEAGKAVKN